MKGAEAIFETLMTENYPKFAQTLNHRPRKLREHQAK